MKARLDNRLDKERGKETIRLVFFVADRQVGGTVIHIHGEIPGENVSVYVKPELVLIMFLNGCARTFNINNQP